MGKQGTLFKDRKRAAPLERAALQACKAFLRARNIYHLRLNSGRLYFQGRWIYLCPAGTPDLFALYKSVALFLEAKRVGESPTLEQLATHDCIRRSGGVVVVAESVEDLRQALLEIDAK